MSRTDSRNTPKERGEPCPPLLEPFDELPADKAVRAPLLNPPARLRLRVSAEAETQIRKGHPWLFDESITEQNRAGTLGELAVLYDKRNRFLAIGFFDPESPLRVRILQRGSPAQIDRSFWQQRLQQTVEKRRAVASIANGYRLLNGESDGWPGLVLDKYDSTLVLKLYTAAWFARLEEIANLIETELRPLRIVLRLSRNIQSLAQEQFGCADGSVIRGAALNEPVVFEESGLRFEADVLRGQKTGFFLDQRENRRYVGKLVEERQLRTVLNAFSFSGGFSLYAAAAGAQSVLDLDISAHALESACRNFALNLDSPSLPAASREVRLTNRLTPHPGPLPVEGRGRARTSTQLLPACEHQTIQADAFEWLARSKEQFDVVILDPPSMARRAADRDQALAAYNRLITRAIPHVRRGGILLGCSCSAHVKEAEFLDAARQAVRKSQRKSRELLTMRQPEDHPATFCEARYLKSIYLEL